jgi:hypothetical protein
MRFLVLKSKMWRIQILTLSRFAEAAIRKLSRQSESQLVLFTDSHV